MMAVAHVLAIVVAVVVWFLVFSSQSQPNMSQQLKTWRDKGRYFRFSNHEIFYKDVTGKGNKGTVICLHGFPTSSWDWNKILPGLQTEFSRVVLLDFLGYGFSDKPLLHNYSIREQADIVEHLAQTLSEQKVHLLAHDYGDTVALELLARSNSAVGNQNLQHLTLLSLTMLNGGIFPDIYYPRLLQRLLLVPVIGPLLSHLTCFMIFKFGFGEIFGALRPTEQEYNDFYSGICHKSGYKVTSQLLQYIPERSANKERWVSALTSTKLPVLMIYGPADPVNPPLFIEHFRSKAPQHKLVVLNKSIGHYPQWESPVEVLRQIHYFLQQLGTKK